jgi:hypothetical protein
MHKTKDRVTRILLIIGGELKCFGRISSSCSTNFMLTIINDTEHVFCYLLLSFFQLIIWIKQQMALTMLEQTMREGYICMCEYIINVNILSNIQYNQMSLSDWTNIYYWNDNNSYHLFTRSKLAAMACQLYIHLPVDLVPFTANGAWWGVLDSVNKRQGIVKGTIKNGHSRDTNNFGHKTQNEDK